MTRRLRAALRAVAESFEMDDAGFAMFGRHFTVHSDGSPSRENILRESVSRLLYDTLHCRGSTDPAGVAFTPSGRLAVRGFVDQLSDANCGAGCWQSGWIVRAIDPDQIVAEKFGVSFVVSPDDCRPTQPEIGHRIDVRVANELRSLMPGYYTALGERDSDADTTLRVYWNVRAEGAVALLSSLTRGLNDAGVAFRFKTLADPAAYERTDAAVLYIDASSWARAWPVIDAGRRRVRRHLRSATSLFVHRVSSGVGVAESPSGGQSFGRSRSDAIANALISTTRRDVSSMMRAVYVVG